MLNHYHDPRNLTELRQAEWEQLIQEELIKKASTATTGKNKSSSRWVHRLIKKFSQRKKKGCDIPSPATNQRL